MDKALERALDHAEGIIESAQHRPPKRKHSSSGGQSLHEKLYDLYVEECGKEPEVTEDLTSNVNLLEKLLRREPLPCLVVNLYPGEKGYSLMLKGVNEAYSETIRLPYEEKEFLEYLDAEELPPILVDLLEKSQANLFHRGCVIAEIRDYRQCSNGEPPGYQSRHILLRPTMQTLVCDVQSIASDDNQKWTEEDKLLLESQMILATAEPLCLDPSVSVACTENRLLYHKQKMNTRAMRRNFQRYSTASLNRRQRELSCGPPPPKLRARAPDPQRKESQAGEQSDLTIFKPGNIVDTWKERPCELEVPSAVDVEKWAEEERLFKYDSQPTVWPAQEVKEGSLFGCEADDLSRTAKPTSMQSLNDPFISGPSQSGTKVRCDRQMSPCHSFTDEHFSSFMPGFKTNAGKAASQSEESGQKSVRYPVIVSLGCSGSAGLSQLSPGKEAKQPLALSVPSSVLGKGVQHTAPPISLSSSSGNNSSGNSSTAQKASSFHASPAPAPAWLPPSLPQRSSVEVNRASRPPAATQPTASSSQASPASQIKASSAGSKVIHLVGPVQVVSTGVRGSNPVQDSSPRARAPAGAKPSSLPPRGWPPDAGLIVPQATTQGSVQYTLESFSNLKPVGLLWVPQGFDISKVQQPQQLLCQLFPEPQPQQPSTSRPLQPASQGSSAQGSSAQSSTSQQTALSAQQAAVIHFNEVGSVLQPPISVLSPPGSAQTRPGPRPAQQRIRLPSAVSRQQPRSQQLSPPPSQPKPPQVLPPPPSQPKPPQVLPPPPSQPKPPQVLPPPPSQPQRPQVLPPPPSKLQRPQVLSPPPSKLQRPQVLSPPPSKLQRPQVLSPPPSKLQRPQVLSPPPSKLQRPQVLRPQVLRPQMLRPPPSQLQRPQVLRPQVLRPQVLRPPPSQLQRPQVLRPQVLRPQVLRPPPSQLQRPQVLRPQVLRPQVLRPQVLRPPPSQLQRPQVLRPQVLRPPPSQLQRPQVRPPPPSQLQRPQVLPPPPSQLQRPQVLPPPPSQLQRPQVLRPQVLRPQVLRPQVLRPPPSQLQRPQVLPPPPLQPQQVRVRILQLPRAMAPAAAQTAQPSGGQKIAAQPGQEGGGLPGTPKS